MDGTQHGNKQMTNINTFIQTSAAEIQDLRRIANNSGNDADADAVHGWWKDFESFHGDEIADKVESFIINNA